MTPLTQSGSVDVGALAGLFHNTTNSYKHLFFQGLLAVLRHRRPHDRVVALDTLAVEMAALGWYPHNYFGVSFGRQDQVGRVLDRLAFSVAGSAIGNAANQRALRSAIQTQAADIDLRSLLRYVPYRLLEPFFEEGVVSGIRDSAKNQRLLELAESEFNRMRPLYRFLDASDGRYIEIHPEWMSYLQDNDAIIEGWAERQWLFFLQGRNPTMPALTEKIRPPTQRSSLAFQARFWDSVLSESPLPCLYSGEPLSPGSYELDHFVPWAFVCHDRPWNLTPVLPEANAAKGHALPDSRYLSDLAHIQAQGLAIFGELVGVNSKRFGRVAEPYLADLGVADSELGSAQALEEAYRATLQPLLALARRSGFPAGWCFPR